MKHRLSDHARKRLLQRGIREEWITATLNNPDITVNDTEDADLVHAIKALPDKGFRNLRVIYNETIDPVTMVTAYFD